jgi:hypothetical protein
MQNSRPKTLVDECEILLAFAQFGGFALDAEKRNRS